MEVYFCMQHIQGYHRHFRWAQFREAFGTDPKGYFMTPFSKLLATHEGYKASVQQGLIEIAEYLANQPGSSTANLK